jgi:hypothetical protein
MQLLVSATVYEGELGKFHAKILEPNNMPSSSKPSVPLLV